MKEVSIIIVCKNAVDGIARALDSALATNPYELIVVDGHSTDGTLDVILGYGDSVTLLTDPGKGIALARQIGINAASGKYVFFMGCDNEIDPDSISRLKAYMLSHGYVYCGMLTRIRNLDSYLARCNNERWKYKITEGPKSIVGTPFLVQKNILDEFPYDTTLQFADDTNLCERITGGGYSIGYSNVVCYEILDNSYAELKSRYIMYGISDAEFYNQHKKEWSAKRRRQSRLHPWRSEFVLGLRSVKGLGRKLYMLPYLFLITGLRYWGWWSHRNVNA
ncbi:MAG: glycosyltransferase family 2 protein [Bacteroidales bacterium]|nr:glycosyltransferase family 2 protein [Bacteroidales bacterium]